MSPAPSPSTEPSRPNRELRATPLRRLLRLAMPEWPLLGAATFFLLLGTGLSLLYPRGIGELVNGALRPGSGQRLDHVALLLLAAFLLQSVAIGLRYYLFTTVGERVVARLRQAVFASLMRQDMGFFDERRTGELTNRLSSDATVLQNTVSANISMGLRNICTALGGVVLLFFISPLLTGLMLAVVPPVALGAVAYGRRVRKLSRELQDALAKANEVAEESLSGIRTVRSFDGEGRAVERYHQAIRVSFELARRRAVQGASFMGGASFASYGAAAAVLWYGGRLVLRQELTLGGLASFLIYTLMIAVSLGSLSDLWADFMKAGGAAERIFELLDRVPTMASSGGQRLAQVEGRVELSGVGFSYPARPDVRVLQDVSLSFAPGQVVAVVGPSGAGKSTLAQLLARLYDPTSGTLRLDGAPLTTLDPGWLRRQVGTVAQEPLLFSGTVAENIRFGRPEASLEDVKAAARTANADAFIQAFPEGYDTLVGERGVQLSGGQKQRVAIARAVLKDPRLLILDEATSALDAENEHAVKEALDRLMKGRTTLVIAHRLSTVMDADRVVVLEAGRVVQQGRHDELMRTEGLYRRLVERQFVGG